MPRLWTNLSPYPTRLIGREIDLLELKRLLMTERLVTVLGPPGVGKTRLAIEYALSHQGEPEGGIWRCDLSEVEGADGLYSVLNRVLELPPARDSQAAASQLEAALVARGETLLLLDGVERLVEVAAPLIDRWRAVSKVKLLITSRVRLGLSGETLFDLTPLDNEEDAVALFLDRARTIHRSYQPTDTQRTQIAQLCQQLDGLPLALELAASRLRVLTPEQLLLGLKERFRLLAPPSGRALKDAIDDSWALLTLYEQAAFSQCALFVGGFSPEAAAAVIKLPQEAPWLLDVLQGLCDKSLLCHDHNTGRYWLYTNLREYALSRLKEAGEEDAVWRRYRQHFLHAGQALAQRLEEDSDPETLRRLEAERENLLSVHRAALLGGEVTEALQVSLALAPLFERRGPYQRGLSLIDAALKRLHLVEIDVAPGGKAGEEVYAAFSEAPSATEASDDLARALSKRGYFLHCLGRLSEAASDYRRGSSLAIEEHSKAECLRGLAASQWPQGLHEEAIDSFTRALTLQREIKDRRGEGRTLLNLAVFSWSRGQLLIAHTQGLQALSLSRLSKDRATLARILTHLGVVELERCELAQARERFLEALSLHRALGYHLHVLRALINLSSIEADLGRSTQARSYAAEAMTQNRSLGSQLDEGLLTANLARLSLEEGSLLEAHRGCERSLSQLSAAPRLAALARVYFGVCLQLEGLLGEARREYLSAREALKSAGDTSQEAMLLSWLGALEVQAGRLPEARSAFDAAKELTKAPLSPLPEALRSTLQVQLSIAQGDLVTARDALTRVESLSQGATPLREQSLDLRLALELSTKALKSQTQILKVAVGAEWFETSSGIRVSLYRRRPLRLLLQALLTRRRESPGKAVPLSQLQEAGWPGQRVSQKASRDRLYTTISTLRNMGLGTLLRRVDDGYLLAPEVPLQLVEEEH